MTDQEAADLAISSVLAVLRNDLQAVAFTDVLRRGLQKWLEQLHDHPLSSDDVQWQNLSVAEKCRFPGLEAFLFHIDVRGTRWEVLVGVDEANWVSEFAILGAPHSSLETYLRYTRTQERRSRYRRSC